VPGGGANLEASAGSGQPLCSQVFFGLPPPAPESTFFFGITSETCRAAWINGRNDILQANESEGATDMWERHADAPPGSGSLFRLGELVQVYGPLDDGFFYQQIPGDSPTPEYAFGWHILNPPPGFPFGFLRPGQPSAGARDPRAGAAIVGAPGRVFPCDPPDPERMPECTGTPPGVYVRAFSGDAALRWPPIRLFEPLDPSTGRVAVGVDVNGWTLVLAIDGTGRTVGRWVDPTGSARDAETFGSLPSGAVNDALLAPLSGGGLAYRRNGEWVRVFDPEHGDAPPPCWLAGLTGFDLRIAASGNGYAAIPTEAVGRHCDRAIDLYTVGGVACGSVALGTVDEACTGHVTLGPQGSVLRLLPGPTLEAGHPTCELRTWPQLLGPSP
jgi:hypothetical protein